MKVYLARVFLVVLLAVGFAGVPQAQTTQARATITEPTPGTLIQNRLYFPVAWSIPDFDRDKAFNFHYWISVATLTKGNEPDLHWPKQYVKAAHSQTHISDGGQNPFPEPQPMLILLLRVDDSTNRRYIEWLKEGASNGYPGFSVNPAEIVTIVPIKFP